MRNLAVRLLTLSMLTASLVVSPLVTQVSAAASSKHAKKKTARVMHQSPRAPNTSANPYASKYEDDFDRKSAGGGY